MKRKYHVSYDIESGGKYDSPLLHYGTPLNKKNIRELLIGSYTKGEGLCNIHNLKIRRV